MGTPMAGSNGTVSADGSAVADVRNWSLDRTADNKTYASSDTGGWNRTSKGNRGATVTWDHYLDGGALDVGYEEGALIAFVGTAASGKTVTGNVRVDSIGQTIDIEGNELEAATVTATFDEEPLVV